MDSSITILGRLIIAACVCFACLSACGSQQRVAHLLVLENGCKTELRVRVYGEDSELPGEHERVVQIRERVPIAIYESVSATFPQQMTESYELRIDQSGRQLVWRRPELLGFTKHTLAQRQSSVFEWVLSGRDFCPAEINEH